VFDERFYMFSEDVDLTIRVRRAGYSLAVCKSSHIRHYGHGTVNRGFLANRMQMQMARSYYLYLEKHRGRAAAEVVSRLLRLAHAARGAAALAEGHLRRDRARRASGRARLSLAAYSPSQPVFADREPARKH